MGDGGNQGLFKFDMTVTVPDAKIFAAEVVLSPWQMGGSTSLTGMKAYRVTSDWDDAAPDPNPRGPESDREPKPGSDG